MSSEKVEPLFDNVLVKISDKKPTTESGLYIPETVANAEKQQLGTVVNVGPGKMGPDGVTIPMHLKVGDKVLFSTFAGVSITYQGEPFLVLKETDILARINK